MAAGGGCCCSPPQIKRESLSVGVSTAPEHTERAVETRRARGDFQLVNRSWMVSLSRADKKKKKCKIIIVIKTKMCHQLYLGGR